MVVMVYTNKMKYKTKNIRQFENPNVIIQVI